jgi:uncharacterized protein DUF4411
MKYCIDTSSMLQAQRAYPMEIFPKVWEHLDALVREGRLQSSEEVLRELERKEQDVVYLWARQRASMFHPLVERIQVEATKIMSDFPKLVDERSGKSFGDPWVIATAIVDDCIVVSEEKPETPDRPHIPIVCESRQVKCIKLLDLIRAEGWVFR